MKMAILVLSQTGMAEKPSKCYSIITIETSPSFVFFSVHKFFLFDGL